MELSSNRRDVRRVLLVTLILNFAVAIGKILVGALSGALAISADGVHSLIDGSANVVALIANRIADMPPDEGHPYGHHRFETLAALGIGVLLVFTAWEIVGQAVQRLQSGETPDISPVTIGVLLATLAVNLFVSRYERREGQRLRSELLIADAANTGADVFVTLSVLVSTGLVTIFGWGWADPLAALIIVVLIGRAAWQVLRQSGGVLVDAAPYTAEQLSGLALSVPAVRQVTRARSRGTADAAHIDIDVEVAPEMTADQTAALADAIETRLRNTLQGVSEVEVHFAPDYDAAGDYALTARAQAGALGMSTHEVRVSEGRHGKVLELHVEVAPGQTLGEAHAQVSRLENQLQQRLPDLSEVVTHIEPVLMDGQNGDQDIGAVAKTMKAQARIVLDDEFPDEDWHDLWVSPLDDGFALHMHLTLPATMSVEAAHRVAEAAEMRLRSGIPGLQRVTIHTEPPEEPGMRG